MIIGWYIDLFVQKWLQTALNFVNARAQHPARALPRILIEANTRFTHRALPHPLFRNCTRMVSQVSPPPPEADCGPLEGRKGQWRGVAGKDKAARAAAAAVMALEQFCGPDKALVAGGYQL
jgi:hypothetical protein